MKITKRPVEVDAWRVSDILWAMEHDWSALYPEVAQAYENGTLRAPTRREITVMTLEGPVQATTEDWLIRGVEGEFYPCKERILRATYDGLPGPGPTVNEASA